MNLNLTTNRSNQLIKRI